jgi:hypothetical protein
LRLPNITHFLTTEPKCLQSDMRFFLCPLFFLIMIFLFLRCVRASNEPERPDAAHSLGFVLSLNVVEGTIAVQKVLCVLSNLS